MIKVGINGFGRIGRMVFRAAVKNFGNDIQIVGINDLLDAEYLAYMLKYDSVHGRFEGEVAVEDGALIVNGNKIRLTAEMDPANLKWNEVDADVVVESTGFFLTDETARKHIQAGAKKVIISAPATNEDITIPLDPTLTPLENGKKYFDRYGKLKRTYEALTIQTKETAEDIQHLESISSSLDIAVNDCDLAQIKEELISYGYMKRKGGNSKKKKQKIVNKPLHFISSDGFHMYVGKNNFQNDELTFKFASGNDWWFHAKGIAGSHVIVKTNGEELPDRTFEEAGRLAGFYSKGSAQDKVEIDYTEKKNIKKPNKAKPGFVVYYTNYSLVISPSIKGIQQIED